MVTATGPGHSLVSRAEGQRLARAELSKAIYHPGSSSPSLISRILNWISHHLGGSGVGAPGGWWGIIALAVLVVIAASAVVYRVGPVARSRAARAGPLLSGSKLSARDHRELAGRLAAAGNYTGAVIESVRAIAVELEERGILPPRVGRTADELAAEASQSLPGQAPRLRAAAQLFNDVRYGDRDGTEAGYHTVRELDAAIRAARPVARTGPLAGTALTGTALTGTALTGTALTGTALTGTALTGTSLTGTGSGRVS
jgi:hypothetical protein